MPVDLVLYNGKICINDTFITAGLAVEEGKIIKIAKKTNLPSAVATIDAKECFILPGLIDVHTHLRDQGQSYEEDFFTGTSAAAVGGITLCLDMPNNEPVTMDSRSLKERMHAAANKLVVNVVFYSAFPEELAEISRVAKDGAVAFKLFLTKQIGGVDIEDDKALEDAFLQAKQSAVPVVVHAEDKNTLENTSGQLKRTNQNNIEAYLKAHSPEVEEKAVKRIVKIIEKIKTHVHFCHISSKKGLDAVLEGKKAGLPLSCEVTPHHLLLSSDHLKRYGTIALSDPPVRNDKNREALWNALHQGLIDIIASDHAPHLLEEKKKEIVWEVKPGFPGLETVLPLLLTQINEGRIRISDLIRLMAEKPAEIFCLNGRGRLAKGYAADITVVDIRREHVIDASKFYSKAKYSPFDGWKARGKPMKTFVNGCLVMEDGEIIAKPGIGQIVGGQR